jgi:hypothetical protein
MTIVPQLYGPLLPNSHRRLPLLSRKPPRFPTPLLTNTHQESARKTLEEMYFLFTPDRTPRVFHDRSATKIGAIFECLLLMLVKRRRWMVWGLGSMWRFLGLRITRSIDVKC